MKIVGFNGSPHNGGNTAWVVEQILEGAKREGAETVSFSACATEIKPCQGCFGCKSASGSCVINDDMQEVYAELKNADVLVFASPIYVGQKGHRDGSSGFAHLIPCQAWTTGSQTVCRPSVLFEAWLCLL